ncbi:MAG: hypothetical protein BWY57_01315 [Betaproteobacteria bacterium ADurb.Bin341]|nr:MAG: hypothetical protein BWY57_01315 [Betaproteobacteria bacterium ADurb.Bin341]
MQRITARLMVSVITIWATAATAGSPGQGINEGFDTGVAGWEGYTSKIKVTHEASGGNPGGYAKADGQMSLGFTTTDARYTGNMATRHLGDFQLDLMPVKCESDTKPSLIARYDASDNGWSFKFNDFACNHRTWKTYTAPFVPTWSDAEATAAGWKKENGTQKSFAETMQHVGRLAVVQEVSFRMSLLGMDNFRINAKPIGAVVPKSVPATPAALKKTGK